MPSSHRPNRQSGNGNGNGNGDSRPTCTSAGSDPDGDGYGWENGQTCIVTDDPEPPPGGGSNPQGPPICSPAAQDPDRDGWGWENNQSCRVADLAAPVELRVDWENRNPVLRWQHPAHRPSFYQVYSVGPGGDLQTYIGTTTGTAFSGLQPDQDVIVVANDSHGNQAPGRVTIEPKIAGTEHSYFTFIATKTQVAVDYDVDESLRTELTKLFQEFDPSLGQNHPTSKNSVKRQYNANRNIGWALVGLNNRTMNQSCCGALHLAFPWAMVPRLVYEPFNSIYKGRSDSDRAFYESWRDASPEQRADYFNIDLEQLDKAAPFFEAASVNLRIINEYRSQEFRAFTAALGGIALGVFTVGLLPPGTSLFAQGATFGAVSAGTTTFIIDGDLADAIEAAAEGAFWGGISGWVQGATGANKVLGEVLTAAGKAHIKGEDAERAALDALRGLAIGAVANNITMETLRTETVRGLTPVFGARTANSLATFAASTSTQILAELSVLYMLDDSIDLEAEAERIFWAHFAARVGDRTTVIVNPLNQHLADVIGAAVTAGITSDWDDGEMSEAAAKALAPVASRWVADQLPAGSDFQEIILLAIGESVGELSETPNADTVINWVIDWINRNTGLELDRR